MASAPQNSMKETELGLIPEEWDLAEVGEVGQVVTGSTPSTKRPEYYSGRYSFIAPGDLGDHTYVSNVAKTLTEEGLAVSRSLPPETVLVVCIGATIGKTGITSDEKSATNQQINAVIPSDGISAQYLYYALTHRAPELPSLAGRAAVPIVNKSNFAKFKVTLPSLPEQRAIAHVLRTVQRAKEATEKVIATARTLKQSLMRHLFTYGPVPFDQADQVELKETEVGVVPRSWRIAPLSDCAVVQTGVAKGRKLNSDDTISVPYLRVANVQDGYLDLTEMKEITIRHSEIERYSLQDGDVVLTEGGDFDKLGRGFIWRNEVARCVHQNHIFAVRVNRDVMSPGFLAHQTQSSYGKAYFLSVAHKTTNLACINTTKLKAFPTLIPTQHEQNEVVQRLRSVDRSIDGEEEKRKALDMLFKALLRNLMTGTVRVRDYGWVLP